MKDFLFCLSVCPIPAAADDLLQRREQPQIVKESN
jgi:hypothetical protein